MDRIHRIYMIRNKTTNRNLECFNSAGLIM